MKTSAALARTSKLGTYRHQTETLNLKGLLKKGGERQETRSRLRLSREWAYKDDRASGPPWKRPSWSGNNSQPARHLEGKERNKEDRRRDVYLSDFRVDGRCSTQKNRILHKILNAGALDLLLDLSCSLLPRSEVNLSNMSRHRPEKRHLVVSNA